MPSAKRIEYNKIIELSLLFIIVPVSFIFNYALTIKVILVILSFIYILFILFKKIKTSFKVSNSICCGKFWKVTLVRFLVIAAVTTIFVGYKNPELLFYVPQHNPYLFITILGVYSLFSVWPQEIIYRTFFVERYQSLFHNNAVLVVVNATLFSLAHLFFKNWLVLVLTFIGGLLFALTYLKNKSTILVSIEHALYGNWLFTVGMGSMLAFPGTEI